MFSGMKKKWVKISLENTHILEVGKVRNIIGETRDGAIRDRWVTTHGVLEK